jgi:hypothetical protein
MSAEKPRQEEVTRKALFKDGCGNWFSLTQHERA